MYSSRQLALLNVDETTILETKCVAVLSLPLCCMCATDPLRCAALRIDRMKIEPIRVHGIPHLSEVTSPPSASRCAVLCCAVLTLCVVSADVPRFAGVSECVHSHEIARQTEGADRRDTPRRRRNRRRPHRVRETRRKRYRRRRCRRRPQILHTPRRHEQRRRRCDRPQTGAVRTVECGRCAAGPGAADAAHSRTRGDRRVSGSGAPEPRPSARRQPANGYEAVPIQSDDHGR